MKKEKDMFLMHVYLIQTGKNTYYHGKRKPYGNLGDAAIFSHRENVEKTIAQCKNSETWKIRQARISLVPVNTRAKKKTAASI